MTMRVTMRNPRRSEDGLSILLVGTTYTVGDDFGQALVYAGHAVDTDSVIATEDAAARDALLASEVRATRALVSGDGVISVAAPGLTVERRALKYAGTGGKLVSDFTSGKWTATVGTPTLTNVTGYNASGVRTGVVSRTGQASMLQFQSTADNDRIQLALGALNVACAGRIGLWVHCANVTNYDTGAGPTTGRIRLEVSTSAASFGNCARVEWTIEGQLREGWNFLKFVQNGAVYNNAANLTAGGANTHTAGHPYGIGAIIFGTGADSEFATNNVRSLGIAVTGCVGWTLTFDAIVTDFESKTVFVLGCDQAAQSCLDIAVPLLASYGAQGYICSPRNVLANPTTATYANMDADASYKDVSSLRATYPVVASVYDAGWDVINHTLTHRSMGYLTGAAGAAEIQMEIDRSRAWAYGGGIRRGGEFYASPQSSTSRLSEAVIAGSGILMQRHIKPINNAFTPFGFDNPNHIGGLDLGNQTNAQTLARLSVIIDNVCRYGDVFFPFWHEIRTLGDPGDGSGVYTLDNLNIYASNFRQIVAYMAAKVASGEAQGFKTPTQLYYGF